MEQSRDPKGQFFPDFGGYFYATYHVNLLLDKIMHNYYIHSIQRKQKIHIIIICFLISGQKHKLQVRGVCQGVCG